MRKLTLLSFPVLALFTLPVACQISLNAGDGDIDGGARNTSSGQTGDAGAVVNRDADASDDDDDDDDDAGDAGNRDADAGASATFAVSGTATYDYVNADDDVTEGAVKLDYGGKTKRPVRRAAVFAMEGTTAVAETVTDDRGAFKLDVPNGKSVKIRVSAQTTSTGNAGTNDCGSTKWAVKVVDNTNADAQYMLEDATLRSSAANGIALNAPLTYGGAGYSARTAAPFAILDTIVTQLKLVCQARPGLDLPLLLVRWSVDNTNTKGDATLGLIGTSHYSTDVTGTSELQILGKEDVDTDEYDDHVIAHEFGHYLEDRLFRSDTTAGVHSIGDVVDPTVAFGEGFGNALAAMTFKDPVYVDTSGVGQSGGYAIEVDAPPVGDDRGVYSEASVQYMLWKLFEARPNGGSLDRIFTVLIDRQRITPGLTSALTFAANYNQLYGRAAEGLGTLWENDLATPFNALCPGACTGSAGGTADVFDADNDIGVAYATTRSYPGTTGQSFSAQFWRVSRPLFDGTNTATAHDQTDFGGYANASNKLGAQRSYRYVSTADGNLTVSIGNLGAGSCTDDVLDMKVALLGATRGFDYEVSGPTAGCPTVTFATEIGKTYTIRVNGFTTEVPSYDIVVARKPELPFTVTAAIAHRILEETDVAIPFVVTPTKDVTHLAVSVRGIDGVRTRSSAGTRLAHPAVGKGVGQSAVARVARGGAGFAVVDVSAIVNGRRVSASYPFQLVSKTPLAKKTIGDVSTDSNGQRVEIMKAVVR